MTSSPIDHDSLLAAEGHRQCAHVVRPDQATKRRCPTRNMAEAAKATEPTIACFTVPCGLVGRDEPNGKRDGTMHERLDGSRGDDKCEVA